MSTNILKGVLMKTYTSLFEGNNPPLWYGELIQGDDTPPPGMKGHGDPFALWLQVEEQLGRGVLPRQIKLSLMTPALEGKTLFQPPSWWRILGHIEKVQTYADDGETKGAVAELPPRARKDGAILLQPGRAAVLTVQIETEAAASFSDAASVRAAVAYALIWAARCRSTSLMQRTLSRARAYC